MRFFFEDQINKVTLPDESIKVLTFLKSKNIYQGIVSNAQFYTEIFLKRALKVDELDFYFNPELVFFSYKLGVAKPDPKIYKNLIASLSKFNIKPENTLFIGNDFENDILNPHNYGFKTAFINKEIDKKGDLPPPDLKVKDLSELLKTLKSLFN